MRLFSSHDSDLGCQILIFVLDHSDFWKSQVGGSANVFLFHISGVIIIVFLS